MNIPFDFSSLDLSDPAYIEANRRGQITQQQRQILGGKLGNAISCFSSFASLFVLPGLGLFGLILLAVLKADALVIFGYAALIILLSLGVFIFVTFRSYHHYSSVKKDLDSGLIQTADGCLEYGKDKYEASLGNGAHLVLPRVWNGLLPGINYLFYYLPGSRIILSAETRSVMPPERAREKLIEILGKANRFTGEDIETNRQGDMTFRQIVRLLPNILVGFLFTLPGIAFLSYFLYILLLAPDADWKENLVAAVIVTIIGGAFAVVGLFITVKSLSDLFSFKAVSIEGEGRKIRRVSRTRSNSRSSSSNTVSYYYRVAEKEFKIPKRAYLALVDGLTYRLYHTPRSSVLLSIEPLISPVPEELSSSGRNT
ncbi:MAG: hypothetical protein EHM41_11130 [Chloroflexi bacterium]|nr:MAG: hypothetical protein EHM41_11130 [Chloroflexota bacterium]